jgi:hypothetical protein
MTCICGVIGIGAQHSAACIMHQRFYPASARHAEIASLTSALAEAERRSIWTARSRRRVTT